MKKIIVIFGCFFALGCAEEEKDSKFQTLENSFQELVKKDKELNSLILQALIVIDENQSFKEDSVVFLEYQSYLEEIKKINKEQGKIILITDTFQVTEKDFNSFKELCDEKFEVLDKVAKIFKPFLEPKENEKKSQEKPVDVSASFFINPFRL